jgi:indole-3-glycerol phosphate synthase
MNVLQRIFETKRQEVEASMARVCLEEMRGQALALPPPLDFRGALEAAQGLALIAEVKKASPSRGLIRAQFDAVEVAQAYRRAGAHALSVLTDVSYFQGSPENLRRAKAATGLPCLRKDFLYHPYQVYEARAWGADAVLLIVAGLERELLADLQALARQLGMAALVEVHTEEEASVAIDVAADLIGVNNRNLSDFATNVGTSQRILPLVDGRALSVSESALETREDLERVRRAGARAVLIGTTFCAAPDVEAKVREVMGW